MEIKGTEHREKPTDYYQACRYCHKLFYFSRDGNGKTVICPHCGARHGSCGRSGDKGRDADESPGMSLYGNEAEEKGCLIGNTGRKESEQYPYDFS